MSDSDVEELGGVQRDSAEHDLTGVDWGVSLGEQIGGSDVVEVEDNDGGSVESDASMPIRTSPLGMPVVVQTSAKGISSGLSTLSVLDVGAPVPFVVVWMSGELSCGFFGSD